MTQAFVICPTFLTGDIKKLKQLKISIRKYVDDKLYQSVPATTLLSGLS